MADRKVIRVSSESEQAIKEYAEAKGVPVGDAADALIGTAVSRLNALRRYAENKGQPKLKKRVKSAKKEGKPSRAKTKSNGASEVMAQA